MKEETFQKLADAEFRDKKSVDQSALDASLKSLTDIVSNETGVQAGNGLYITGKLDTDMNGVLVTMKIPAQRTRWQHFINCDVVVPNADEASAELKQDGPTVKEFVDAGYRAKNYPPAGYASKSSDDEVAEAIKAQEQDDAASQGNDNGSQQDADSARIAEELAGINALLERERAADPTLTDDDKAKLLAYHEAHPAQQD